MSDERLLDFGSTLLTELVSYLDGVGIAVPVHQYFHVGEIAHDFTEENCADALVVSFDGFVEGGASTTGLPGTVIKCAVPLVAQWTIALLRCVPALTEDSDAPTAAELEESATSLLVDAMELANALISIYLGSSCSLRSIGSLRPVGPSGGAGGHICLVFQELV